MWTESDEDCLCRTLGTDPSRCPYTDPVSGGCRGRGAPEEASGNDHLVLPDWAKRLKDASEVQVKVTKHSNAGEAYVMYPPGEAYHLLICHPQDHQEVKNLLYHLRGPIKALVEDWG